MRVCSCLCHLKCYILPASPVNRLMCLWTRLGSRSLASHTTQKHRRTLPLFLSLSQKSAPSQFPLMNKKSPPPPLSLSLPFSANVSWSSHFICLSAKQFNCRLPHPGQSPQISCVHSQIHTRVHVKQHSRTPIGHTQTLY